MSSSTRGSPQARQPAASSAATLPAPPPSGCRRAPRVAAVTRTNEREAFAITAMLYGMIPSAVTLWQSGALTKEEAVEHLMRGVGGLIDAYTKEQDLH